MFTKKKKQYVEVSRLSEQGIVSDYRPASDEGEPGKKRKNEVGRFENCIWQEKAEISTCKSPWLSFLSFFFSSSFVFL